MKILVLGGCGFIGSHVIDALLVRGHDVRVFDRRPERFRPPLRGVEYLFGEFSDRATLIEALSGVDSVFHLISTTLPGTANLDPQADVEGNLINTLFLVESMIGMGVKRLLFLSSGGTVYGVPQITPIPEDHPLRPINSYGIVKVAIEQYLAMYLREERLAPVIIRASNPYGPRQGHAGVQGVVSTFFRRIMSRQPVEVWGNGSVVRDYFYVEDLARLCVIAAETDAIGAFNAGSGAGVSVNELIVAIAEATGVGVQRAYKPARLLDVPVSVLDVSRAREAFEWSPSVKLVDGLKANWAWLLAQSENQQRS